MPIEHQIWTVEERPRALSRTRMPTEAMLESMIVAAPEILSDEWMLIGQQISTGHGGRVDLLAIAPDGALIIIELKRDQTPRDVIAQSIDYAAWAEDLDIGDLNRIFARFSGGSDLSHAFRERFGVLLDEDECNKSHQIVVLATGLDASTERVVNYLNDKDIPINILFFQVFETDAGPMLSRAWLIDPVETQIAASNVTTKRNHGPWNGEFYVSYGHSAERRWQDALQYNFVSAGGGKWFTGTLDLLDPGHRIWVKAPGYGFVGVGRVAGSPVRASEFEIRDENGEMRPALDVLRNANYHRQYADDAEKSEYFLPVEWVDTKPLDAAVQETGMFGNQNTVCRPRTENWNETVDRLKRHFAKWDEDGR